MNFPKQLSAAMLALALVVVAALGLWWVLADKSAGINEKKDAPAAVVAKVVNEGELNTIALTEAAEKKLGLKIATVQKKAVRRVRVYGGEVTIPIGRSIAVASPLGGTLKAPLGGNLKAGEKVKHLQEVFHLLPLLTGDARATLSASLADAEGLVSNARAQADLSRTAYDRAKKVLKEGAGSQRQVDEAQAAFEVASKTLDAATARKAVLAKALGDVEAGTGGPISINAPLDGLLRNVTALPGQTVPGGAPLFEVMDGSVVWVRVALPAGDLDAIDRSEPARLGKLSSPPDVWFATAKLVAAPPSANPLSSTVDVFYEASNDGGILAPGHRVNAAVPLTDAKESPTLPWSAIVYDINGGTWVYQQLDGRRYVRRRIIVQYTAGTDAVLANGPAPGTKIVAEGVLELFGAETGFAK